MATTDRVSSSVVQAKHGFSRGQCVLFNGTNWVLATSGSAGVGVVGSLESADVFEFVSLGLLDGLDTLIPGATYYPSALGISINVSGVAIGTAYTDTKLFVSASGASTPSAPIDTSGFVTTSALNAATASINAALAAHNHDSRYTHSVEFDGVISVEPGNSGLVFLEADGTQVLLG